MYFTEEMEELLKAEKNVIKSRMVVRWLEDVLDNRVLNLFAFFS